MPAEGRKWTGLLVLSVIVSAVCSGFQHGYNTGVLNTPEKIIKGWVSDELNSPTESNLKIIWSAIVSLYAFGGIFGGALAGVCANGLGRKGALMFNNAFVIIGGIILALSKWVTVPWLLMVGRFIVGINSGMNAGLAPLYISEISPTRIRGALGSMYQLSITISILIAQLLGMESVLGTKDLWPYDLLLVVVVGILQIVGFIFCPESPKYLLEKKNDEEKSKNALKKLVAAGADEQFAELKKDIDDAKKTPNVTFPQFFKTKKLRTPLIIICTLMVAQQLTGINAVIFYSTEIFTIGKLSQTAAQYSTVGVGVVNVLSTIVSVWLVERFGRKPLLLVAFAGCFVTMAILLVCLYFVESVSFIKYFSIVVVYLYLISFASGAGSIPWLLGPELFNTGARPTAISIAVPINWFFSFAVGLLFPPLQGAMGPAVFAIFIACTVAAFVFTWIFVPETKNRTIDDITTSFE